MSKDKVKKDPRELLGLLRSKFVRYRVVVFVIFVALVYGYVLAQINSFNNAAPDPLAISNQASSQAQLPHIDKKTVNKIENLKDNSVNVQALFNQVRDNPFSSQ